MGRPVVATEVCGKTGSFLGDLGVHSKKASQIRNLEVLISERVIIDSTFNGFNDIKSVAGVDFPSFILRRKSAIEEAVSYRLHTNRELLLMLEGRKDFAVFSRHVDEAEEACDTGQKFDDFRHIVIRSARQFHEIVFTFYFIAGAEWKVDAYLNLHHCVGLLGACRQTEYIEGSLLGYSHEENMEYLDRFWPK